MILIITKGAFKIGAFPFYLAVSILEITGKLVKLALTFFMNGIIGVQKKLSIGTFAEKIHYAVLKENGQYLKLANKTL